MFKKSRFVFISVICLLISAISAYAQDSDSITIVTYYPSPYGSYNQLQTNSLGVGDNNNNGTLDAGDVPPTLGYPNGDVWIAGNVGIGTTGPGVKLHIDNKGLTGLTDTTVYDVFKLSNTRADGTGLPKGSNFAIGLSRWENPGNNYPRTQVDFKTTGLTTDNNTTPNTIMSLRDNGNVGIGTASPQAKLDVNGQVKISGGSPGKDKVLISSDASGLASWSPAAFTPNPMTGGDYTEGEICFPNGYRQKWVHTEIGANDHIHPSMPSGWVAIFRIFPVWCDVLNNDDDLSAPQVMKLGGVWYIKNTNSHATYVDYLLIGR